MNNKNKLFFKTSIKIFKICKFKIFNNIKTYINFNF